MPWSDDWDEQLYADGHQTGRNWVAHGTRPENRRGELRRLQHYYESESSEVWLDADSAPDKYVIMSKIDLGSEQDPRGTAETWQQMVGFRTDSDVEETEFILGFIEGALELEPSVVLDDDEETRTIQDSSHAQAEPESAAEPPEVDESVGKELRGFTFPDDDARAD